MTTTADEFLSDLRRVLDAVDGGRVTNSEAAKAALGWRTLDAELAELSFDSAVDQSDVVLRGSSAARRLLTFSSTHVTIEVELSGDRLIGKIVPPQPASIEVCDGASGLIRTATSDEFGVFTIVGLPVGPASFLCRADDGSWTVRTEWTIA